MYLSRILSVVLVALLFGTGIILAGNQNDSSALRCDLDDLLDARAELDALLEDFEDALADDAEDALGTLYEVGAAHQQLAIDCGFIPPDIGERYVGEDVDAILLILDTLRGDPLNGQLLYNNEERAADGTVLGCVGCHMNEDIAPLTEGTWSRWDEIRRFEPEWEDATFEQFIVQSIVLPWESLAPGYAEVMPNNFGDRLSYQNLADLIAYLESQDQLLD